MQEKLRTLITEEENDRTINSTHIGRKCIVLNPHKHQPAEGTIIGFTKGENPFVKVKEKGFVVIRRLPKNLRLKERRSDSKKKYV